MYKIRTTTGFLRDLKRVEKRGYRMDLLSAVVKKLAAGESLDRKYKDHPLKGEYIGCRECHITPDWLLVYEIENDTLFLYLLHTGTHSDIF